MSRDVCIRGSAVGLERLPHRKTDAKSSINRPVYSKAASSIEAARVRISNDVQKAGSAHTSDVRGVIEEFPSDAMLPEVRLHEQRIQLRTAVGAWHHRGETHDDAVAFGDEDATLRNLFDRHRDRVWIGEDRLAITWIAE